MPASETPWMRAREVWIHAVDLDNGASFHDFEPELLDALLADVTGLWQRKQQGPSLVLRPTDRESAEYRVEVEGSAPRAVRGSTADLVRWVTGRGAVELEADGGELPRLGRWL